MQGVYADVDDVVVVVGDLDHLLEPAVGLRHADESSEATDAVVDVYDVVADLELLEFLQREGHLAGACALAAEVVLVEAVEDLVVGEEAHLQGVVDESCVECPGDGGEAHSSLRLPLAWMLRECCFEDDFQAVGLLGRVGQHVESVAFVLVVLEGLRQQVEVLVEDGLRGDGEVHDGGRCPCAA